MRNWISRECILPRVIFSIEWQVGEEIATWEPGTRLAKGWNIDKMSILGYCSGVGPTSGDRKESYNPVRIVKKGLTTELEVQHMN